MLENRNYEIAKMHICNLEKKDNLLSFDLNTYPERLCIIDRLNKSVIDVETCHQYLYIRVMNMQYFLDIDEIRTLEPNKRVACIEYATLPYMELDLKTLKRCENIIKLLKAGAIFPDGNRILTNEEYLKIADKTKNTEKVKKMQIKRK